MILKNVNFKSKKGMIAITIMLTLLLGLMGSIAAYAAYNGNDDKVLDENVTTEGVGGSSPADDSNSIFLDSYYKQTPPAIFEADKENITIEGVGGSSLNEITERIGDSTLAPAISNIN